MLGTLVPEGINFVQTLHDQGAECITKQRFHHGEVCTAREAWECARCASASPNALQRAISAHAVRVHRQEALEALRRHKSIFVSNFLAERFKEVVAAGAELRSSVVHNFIDSQRIRTAVAGNTDQGTDGRPMILMTGRIDRAKGFQHFLEALPDHIFRSMNVTVCGDGPDLEALPKATGEAQIVFLLLLSRARHPRREVDSAVAETLETVAARVAGGLASPAPDLQGALSEDDSAGVYRTLAAALGRLAFVTPAPAPASPATPVRLPQFEEIRQ